MNCRIIHAKPVIGSTIHITLGNKQSRVSFASTGEALLNQQNDRVAYDAVVANNNRWDPFAFRCSPLYRRLRFAEVDFNRAQIGLAHGG